MWLREQPCSSLAIGGLEHTGVVSDHQVTLQFWALRYSLEATVRSINVSFFDESRKRRLRFNLLLIYPSE